MVSIYTNMQTGEQTDEGTPDAPRGTQRVGVPPVSNQHPEPPPSDVVLPVTFEGIEALYHEMVAAFDSPHHPSRTPDGDGAAPTRPGSGDGWR